MTTIGYATLQLIPSLLGVTEAIDQQIDGKVVSIQIAPKVDQKATDTAGKQVKEAVEKQTTEVIVAPKVDPKAADTAGRQTKEAVEKHTRDVVVEPKVDPKATTEAVIGALEDTGETAGRALGERIAQAIPTGMTGVAGVIGNLLRASLPALGAATGAATGTSIGVAITNAMANERFQKAGDAVKRGLTNAVDKANVGTDIAIKVGNSVAGGLSNASGTIEGFASRASEKVEAIGGALSITKDLLGGDDSWAAPGLDALTDTLGKATPLLEGMNAAATLAAAGSNAIALASKAAAAAQVIWNAAMAANPIGAIVLAVAALTAGIIYAYNHSETFRKIVDAAWKAIKVAAEAVANWFVNTAWPMLKKVWEGIGDGWSWLVTKAGELWTGVKEKFTAIVDFVRGIPSAITNAAKGMWDGLKNGLVTVLNWIGDKWNAFADTFSIDIPGVPKIPHMPKFVAKEGFDGGGYTGNISRSKIAGVVHGDEFVIRASSQRRIENLYPGLLDFMNNKGALPGYAGGGLVAGSAQLRKIIGERFGISNIGGYRPADGYNEHSTGRALDVMVGNDKPKGDAVKDFAVDNASAIDLKWAIWQQKLWYPGGGSEKMATRANGDPTQNHMDHVHIFSGPGITNGLLGALKGKGDPMPANAEATASGSNPPVGDTTPVSSSSDATPVAAGTTGSSGLNMPSSISGTSSWGLNGLGAGLGTTPGGSDLSLLSNAAGAAVGGQVSSALGVFGVPDTPGWLQGISTFVSGLSVSDKSGKKIFGGGSAGGALGRVGNPLGSSAPQDGYGDAAPIAASANVTAAALPTGDVHGSRAGQAPGPVYNTTIQARDAEEALVLWQRKQDEMIASKLGSR